jgi:glycine/D-amino acid oxidase-like deaminating enzyme
VLVKGDGLLIAGTTEERVGFRARPTRAGRAHIIAAALRLAPGLSEAVIVNHTACLRPLSSDTLPILGPVPGWEGLFLATGHGRRGILLGPISGQAVARLALGQQPPVPLEAFALSRLATTAPTPTC